MLGEVIRLVKGLRAESRAWLYGALQGERFLFRLLFNMGKR